MPELKTRTNPRQDLRTEHCSPSDLAPGARAEMYALFARAHAASDRRFLADLDAKRDGARRLAGALAVLSTTGRAAAEARFCARRNPGYLRGEELVCHRLFDACNIRPFARRFDRRAIA